MGTRGARPSNDWLRHSDKDDAEYEAVRLDDVKRVTAAKVLAKDKFVISVVKPGK